MILAGLMLMLALIYCRALDIDAGRAGIWQDYDKERVHQDIDEPAPFRVKYRTVPEWLWFGFYFSLISTFNIGWRDLNVGSWISRIQPGEYPCHSVVHLASAGERRSHGEALAAFEG